MVESTMLEMICSGFPCFTAALCPCAISSVGVKGHTEPLTAFKEILVNTYLNISKEINPSQLTELNHQTKNWISFSRVAVHVSSVCLTWNICSGIHNLRSRLDWCHWSAETPKLNLYPSSHLSAEHCKVITRVQTWMLSPWARGDVQKGGGASTTRQTNLDSHHKWGLNWKNRLMCQRTIYSTKPTVDLALALTCKGYIKVYVTYDLYWCH